MPGIKFLKFVWKESLELPILVRLLKIVQLGRGRYKLLRGDVRHKQFTKWMSNAQRLDFDPSQTNGTCCPSKEHPCVNNLCSWKLKRAPTHTFCFATICYYQHLCSRSSLLSRQLRCRLLCLPSWGSHANAYG